jgi:hypothetical protein
VLLQHF